MSDLFNGLYDSIVSKEHFTGVRPEFIYVGKQEYGEMIESPIAISQFYIEKNATEKCCPKCGHNEFYEID